MVIFNRLKEVMVDISNPKKKCNIFEITSNASQRRKNDDDNSTINSKGTQSKPTEIKITMPHTAEKIQEKFVTGRQYRNSASPISSIEQHNQDSALKG